MPELDYGNMRPGIRRYIGITVFRLANIILAASEFAKSELIKNAWVPASKVKVVHLGFEPTTFDSEIDKEKVVLCVGFVDTSNLKRKGIATFVQAAKLLPEVKFILIGKHVDNVIDELRSIATPNVIFSGFVEDLTRMLETGSVIVQVSAHEGFGCAVAEGMLKGCIPVVTEVGSLPEVVGDTGIYVPYGDPQATAMAIKKALDVGKEQRMLAHARIKREFSLSLRRQRVYEVVDQVF